MALTADERIRLLVDRDSFRAFEPELPAGWITGRGALSGRPIYVSAYNTVPGKCPPLDSIGKQLRFFETVLQKPAPVVLLLDALLPTGTSAGKTALPPQSTELQVSERGVGKMYFLQAQLSKVVPQVGVAFGKVGAALSFPLGMADAAVLVKGSAVSIGRPDAVRLMIGQETDFEKLGGALMHCSESGVGDTYTESEEEAMEWVKRYLSYFPTIAGEKPSKMSGQSPSPAAGSWSDFDIPEPSRVFEMHKVLNLIVDDGTLFELKELYAQEVITALARVEGRVVGLIANNAKHRGGILFPESCKKMIPFIQNCDAFGIPLVFLADTPGFMVGEQVERAGIVRYGAELFKAISQTKVPRICIVVRRAYTAGLYAMSGPGFSPTSFLAMPSASIAVFGRKALERFRNEPEITEIGKTTIDEIIGELENPSRFLAKGLVQEIVDGENIRSHITAII